jgi:hypothetical protein
LFLSSFFCPPMRPFPFLFFFIEFGMDFGIVFFLYFCVAFLSLGPLVLIYAALLILQQCGYE